MSQGGNPYVLEHYGKAPLPGVHACDEVLLVGAGCRPPAPSEVVSEGSVRRAEAVAQVPGKEQEGVVSRVLLESAVPHGRWRRRALWGCQVQWERLGLGLREARPQGSPQGGSGQP